MEEFIGKLIAFLIIAIPMGLAYWHLIYNQRQENNKKIAEKIEKYISFDERTNTLNVYAFHPQIYRVITIDRYEILHTGYQPETYTYTSATIGNVTYGELNKNEGYKYISGSSKTNKHVLCYLHKSIWKIKLHGSEVIDKAKRAGLEKYMNSAGEIIVVGKARVSQEALKSALSGYYAQMQIEGLDAYPSYDKCSHILDFLNSAKGQPVPKEKMAPAKKKALVGLLIFFLTAVLLGGGYMGKEYYNYQKEYAQELFDEVNSTSLTLVDPAVFGMESEESSISIAGNIIYFYEDSNDAANHVSAFAYVIYPKRVSRDIDQLFFDIHLMIPAEDFPADFSAGGKITHADLPAKYADMPLNISSLSLKINVIQEGLNWKYVATDLLDKHGNILATSSSSD